MVYFIQCILANRILSGGLKADQYGVVDAYESARTGRSSSGLIDGILFLGDIAGRKSCIDYGRAGNAQGFGGWSWQP
jgi:hypothetical protein